ncbi:MAG TPA: ATP-binding protein [Sphingomicrobium sp.]|jgi:signal transduction histidine kinase|nr:ATP-binding protein [Sphingomicrobium sp.]
MLAHHELHRGALADAIRACDTPAAAPDPSARAAENITALGEMTRGIAHDFRNVLCMLTSGLNIAQASADDPAQLKLALAAMQEGILRGLRVTNRLLDFARQQQLEPGIDDINSLLAAMKTFLSYGAGPGIRVVLELAPHLPDCLVDPPQLNAAILNLIVNARDAMPDGGVIRISTALVHRRKDGDRRDYVRVRVRDNGAGMPPEVLARIFDPFFTTKGDRGTGLGVPQVRASMQRVHGDVTVRSTPGKGTAFDLFFPTRPRRPSRSDVGAQLDRWADEGGAVFAA